MKRGRKIGGLLAAMGLATGLTVLGTGTAHADPVPPAAPGWAELYMPRIHAQGITLCVDNPNDADGTHALQLWRCHGYASNGGPQRWEFIPVGTAGANHTIYRIVNVDSGLCIGQPNPSFSGATLLQESCFATSGIYPGTSVDWILEPIDATNPTSDFQLENVNSSTPWEGNGFCMAANTFSDTNGTRLILAPCSYYDTSQYFNLG
jgi:hypothetical protein